MRRRRDTGVRVPEPPGRGSTGGAALSSLRDDFLAFCDAFNVGLYAWQRDAFGAATRREAGRFAHPLAGISIARGNGKSYAAAAVGVWRLLCGPQPQLVLSAALDYEGAKIVLDHARTIVRRHPDLEHAVEIRADSLLVPSTGSRWLVRSREHTASRGLHPDLVIYDEIGWAKDDELFASLLAAQASSLDPLMLVVSTVGRRQSGPLWTIKQLAEHRESDDPETAADAPRLADLPDPGSVFWWHTTENLSPRVTGGFLARVRRFLMPAQFAREHSNQWVDGAEAFVPAEHVDRAMSHGWTEQAAGRPGTSYVAAVDLGAVHDPTVIAIGHADAGALYVDTLVTFQGSRAAPVDLATVEHTLQDLDRLFPFRRVRVESWQGLGTVQRLERLGLPVELFTPTAKAHADEWPMLAQALAAGTLVLPPHARLREELVNLTVEVGPAGVRVTDRGKIHQDHAVAVRMVVAALMPFLYTEPVRLWGGPSLDTTPAATDDTPRVTSPADLADLARHAGWRFPGARRW